MVSSNKLVLLCLIFGLLLSTLSRPAGGQLLGIRWGRNYQDNDVNHEVHKPKLWESMTERKYSPEIVQGRGKFSSFIYSFQSMLKDEALIYFSNKNIILGTMSKFIVTN